MEPNGRRQDPQAGSSKPPRVDRRRRSLGAAGLVALVFLGVAGPLTGRAVQIMPPWRSARMRSGE